MAHIKNIQLEVEKGSLKSKAIVKSKFDIHFSDTERGLGMQFGLFVALYEVDFQQDLVIPVPNGFSAVQFTNLDPILTGTKNSQDDAVGWLHLETLRPGRRRVLTIKIEREIQIKYRNVSNESFRVCAYVVPDISAGFAVSNEVVIPNEKEQTPPNKAVTKPRKPKSKAAITPSKVSQTTPKKATAKPKSANEKGSETTQKVSATASKPTTEASKVQIKAASDAKKKKTTLVQESSKSKTTTRAKKSTKISDKKTASASKKPKDDPE